MQLHILAPVYNERDNIARTLDEIERHVRHPHDITLIYDFDEDNTLPAARAWAEAHPGVRLHLLRNDLGKGVVHALKKGLGSVRDGAALVVMADLADDMAVIDRMVEVMESGYDVVCGSRYMAGGRQIGGPRFKGFLSRMAGLTLHWITGIPTHDVTNSFKMYSARLLQRVVIESRGGFEVGLELVVKCFVGGGRVTEVASTWRDRTAGQSRFRLVKWLPHYLRWYGYAIGCRFGLFRPHRLF